MSTLLKGLNKLLLEYTDFKLVTTRKVHAFIISLFHIQLMHSFNRYYNLQNFLDQVDRILAEEGIISKITENSLEDTSDLATWQYLFQVAHEILLHVIETFNLHSNSTFLSYVNYYFQEADKVNKSKKEVVVPKYASSLMKTVSYHGTKHLKISSLLQNISGVLASEEYKCLHQIYAKILIKNVLPQRQSTLRMNYKKWQGLLDICLDIFANPATNLDLVDATNALTLVIKIGCTQSRLNLDLKQALPRIGENLHSDHFSN